VAAVASGVRLTWMQIPAHVRAGIEAIIGGAAVVSAVSQSGGFSPGTADRVVTVEGRRAFVKAASTIHNEQTPSMHRAEAHVVGQLPSNAYVPALLGVYDDGVWVGLVFEDVDGHTPAVPWNAVELEAAMTALVQMAEAFTPSPVPDLPSVTSFYANLFAGWERIPTEPPTDLCPWARHHLDDLCRLADRGLACLAGDGLLHTDSAPTTCSSGPTGPSPWWTGRGPATEPPGSTSSCCASTSISTVGTTPRSWCSTTWGLSIGTTSPLHWRVYAVTSPTWLGSRRTQAFRPYEPSNGRRPNRR
jgi:hypothetical protein